MMTGVILRSWKGVKLHIPLIKFRKGGPYTDKTSSAAAAAAPSGNKPSSGPTSLRAQQLPLIEDWQLPPHYRRTPLDEKEIDAINTSEDAIKLKEWVKHLKKSGGAY